MTTSTNEELKGMKHGHEGTHSVCDVRLKKGGGKARCCICEPHDECKLFEMPGMVDSSLATEQKEDWEKDFSAWWYNVWYAEKGNKNHLREQVEIFIRSLLSSQAKRLNEEAEMKGRDEKEREIYDKLNAYGAPHGAAVPPRAMEDLLRFLIRKEIRHSKPKADETPL